MKQWRTIFSFVIVCVLFIGCRNYERQKDTMVQSVYDYKLAGGLEGDTDLKNLTDLSSLLSQCHDVLDMSLIKYCLEKEMQSALDLQLSSELSLHEYDLITGASQKALGRMSHSDYLKDIQKLKSIISACDSSELNSDNYSKALSKIFDTALKKLQKKDKEDDLLGFLMLFAGNTNVISDRFEIIHDAYYNAFEFLLFAPEIYISDYCNIVIRTIKNFSGKLDSEEFYTIYMDMINTTAANYLGSDIVDMINTYSRYSYITDREILFERYLATSAE